RVSSGKLTWDGADVTAKDVRSRNVAMVYQQFVNYPPFTVYENIASPLRLLRIGEAEIDRRVRETAGRLHIDRLLERMPAELSGGQQQRTAIARALVKRADLVLLDEPLANLDYKLREELRVELRGLLRESNAIVVYATSDPTEALLLGGRTAVIDEGRLLQIGAATDVYRAPCSDRVGQVYSDPEMNMVEAEITGERSVRLGGVLSFPLQDPLPMLEPGRYRFGIRAHHLRLARASDADLRIPAVAFLEEVSGSETLLHAKVGSVALTALLPGVHRHPLGAELDLFIAPAHFFVFDASGRLVVCARAPYSVSAPSTSAIPYGPH
ncbi:MAG TPA: ABC transporter ATP-binding protein, partial [Polyangiales bacterium]|nr:ABC transporter ATP-binding protein [Polyangiales bacterium]